MLGWSLSCIFIFSWIQSNICRFLFDRHDFSFNGIIITVFFYLMGICSDLDSIAFVYLNTFQLLLFFFSQCIINYCQLDWFNFVLGYYIHTFTLTDLTSVYRLRGTSSIYKWISRMSSDLSGTRYSLFIINRFQTTQNVTGRTTLRLYSTFLFTPWKTQFPNCNFLKQYTCNANVQERWIHFVFK